MGHASQSAQVSRSLTHAPLKAAANMGVSPCFSGVSMAGASEFQPSLLIDFNVSFLWCSSLFMRMGVCR